MKLNKIAQDKIAQNEEEIENLKYRIWHTPHNYEVMKNLAQIRELRNQNEKWIIEKL